VILYFLRVGHLPPDLWLGMGEEDQRTEHGRRTAPGADIERETRSAEIRWGWHGGTPGGPKTPATAGAGTQGMDRIGGGRSGARDI